jgi:uncharacterized ion transporter superfamily protein YfcC
MLLVGGRLGYPPVAAVGMCFILATVGGAFSPMNPFEVGIAQKLAGLPLLSGWTLRVAFLVPALALSIWWTMRVSTTEHGVATAPSPSDHPPFTARAALVLLLLLLGFVLYVIGVIRWDWDFDQMSALFLVLGIAAGLVGGLGVGGTSHALADGFRGMAFSVVIIGVARAIYVVLQDGRIIDTIVYGLFVPVSHLPAIAAAVGMMAAQAVLHVPVPSTSGQAVLSMPILVPLADLIGLTAQVTVLAYQYGAGLCEMLTPTNGALMAVLVAAGVSYEEWIGFVMPLYLLLMLLAAISLGTAVALHVM